jgi:hypothetical protein
MKPLIASVGALVLVSGACATGVGNAQTSTEPYRQAWACSRTTVPDGGTPVAVEVSYPSAQYLVGGPSDVAAPIVGALEYRWGVELRSVEPRLSRFTFLSYYDAGVTADGMVVSWRNGPAPDGGLRGVGDFRVQALGDAGCRNVRSQGDNLDLQVPNHRFGGSTMIFGSPTERLGFWVSNDRAETLVGRYPSEPTSGTRPVEVKVVARLPFRVAAMAAAAPIPGMLSREIMIVSDNEPGQPIILVNMFLRDGPYGEVLSATIR